MILIWKWSYIYSPLRKVVANNLYGRAAGFRTISAYLMNLTTVCMSFWVNLLTQVVAKKPSFGCWRQNAIKVVFLKASNFACGRGTSLVMVKSFA